MRDRSVFSVSSLVVLALSVGCSAPDAESLGTSREAASTPFANDKAAYDYFIGKGLTNLQAAGVVGNLDQESGVNPTISQSGGGVGRGIAQWSAGARWDTTKNDNVLAYATQQGKSAMSLELQLDFVWYELTTFPEYGLAALKATTTLNDATQVFEDQYEGCVYANYPECALPARVTYAKNVLAAFGSNTGQGGAGGGGAGGGGGAWSGAGSANVAGSAGSGGAGVAGSPGSGGGGASGSGASVAGSSTVAGSSSVGGSPSSAGGVATAGAASNPFGSRDSNDASCSFSASHATQSGLASSLAALTACCASLLSSRRRKQRRAH